MNVLMGLGLWGSWGFFSWMDNYLVGSWTWSICIGLGGFQGTLAWDGERKLGVNISPPCFSSVCAGVCRTEHHPAVPVFHMRHCHVLPIPGHTTFQTRVSAIPLGYLENIWFCPWTPQARGGTFRPSQVFSTWICFPCRLHKTLGRWP